MQTSLSFQKPNHLLPLLVIFAIGNVIFMLKGKIPQERITFIEHFSCEQWYTEMENHQKLASYQDNIVYRLI